MNVALCFGMIGAPTDMMPRGQVNGHSQGRQGFDGKLGV